MVYHHFPKMKLGPYPSRHGEVQFNSGSSWLNSLYSDIPWHIPFIIFIPLDVPLNPIICPIKSHYIHYIRLNTFLYTIIYPIIFIISIIHPIIPLHPIKCPFLLLTNADTKCRPLWSRCLQHQASALASRVVPRSCVVIYHHGYIYIHIIYIYI